MSQVDKVDERRSFEFIGEDGTTTYYLELPSADQIRKADWHYSKIYNKALVEGVATEAEMLDILKSRNIYSPEYLKELDNLQVDIAAKITYMDDLTDDLEKMKLALEIKELRNKLYQWNLRVTGPLGNTCERMAEDARTEYITSVAVRKADGAPLWKSYDDFVAEQDAALLVKARFEVILWTQGYTADILKTPEDAVIKDVVDGRTARAEAKALQAAAQEAEQMADAAVQNAEESVTVASKKKRSKKSS
jgi:hypothetical protein